MNLDGSVTLLFLQNIEYKNIELLQCEFSIADEEVIKTHVSYRYQLAKIKHDIANDRLKEISKIVK